MNKIKIPLRCECSTVEGFIEIKPKGGNNIVCHCDDCQAFAKYLGREDVILTKNLGTELFQVTPNQLHITKGKDSLACMKLKPKGLCRWYTNCCKTPVANTINGKMAFNGVYHRFIEFESMEIPKEEALGAVQTYCMTQYGQGEFPKNSHLKYPISATLKIIKMLLGGLIFGTNRPNQFFDEVTLMPISKPTVLSLLEREELSRK